VTVVTPAHLPARLAICLWDFSWYTRAGAGEPFEDLDRAFRETVDRGYNTVRICAAPLLTFGELGLDPRIGITGLGEAPDGGRFGRGMRWYDADGGYELDVRERLLELFRAAERHGVVVILASWEYQQSSAFAATPEWWRAIDAIPAPGRYDALAAAFDRMLAELEREGLLPLVAFTELHNEVDFSPLPGIDTGEGALAWLRARWPGQLVTASFGKVPRIAGEAGTVPQVAETGTVPQVAETGTAPQVAEASTVPRLDPATVTPGLDVAQFHIYTYGVLDALQRRIDLRSEGTAGFPNAELRGLLVDGAPEFADYNRIEPWRLEATVVTDQMVYGYDFLDAAKWDAWLVDHYPDWRDKMHAEMSERILSVAAWAVANDVPQVVGEGWIGYTPLRGRFEEGDIGLALAEHGIRTALAAGAWGMVLCSNAAPHHPMWAQVDWQRRMNAEITASGDR
jgi:hypothetical protein